MNFLKNLILAVIVSLLLINHVASQDTPKRSSLLNKRAGTRNAFQKSTTTTEASQYEEGDYEEGAEGNTNQEAEYAEEQSGASTTTTSTEKVVNVIRPTVRPFRSNDDLLSALKKRRQNEKLNKSAAAAVTEKPVQEEKNYEQAETKTTKAKPTTTTAQKSAGNRRFGNVKSTNVKAPVAENQAQDIEEPASKPFKRPSRFALKQ